LQINNFIYYYYGFDEVDALLLQDHLKCYRVILHNRKLL